MATFLRIAIVAAAVAVQPGASAAEFPSRPITIVVPYTAGGPTDIVGRLIAESMSQTLKTPVLIENVGGAGGTRGAGQVARAAADGHTLLLHNIGQATSATIYRKLPYNALKSFQPVGLITDVPMTLIGRTGLKANSLNELLALLKENNAKLNFGHAGIGSAAHLCGLLLASVANVQVYQGSSQSLRDMVAGQIDIGCDQTTNTTPQIASGQIKAFAVTTPTRLKSLPNIPTASEAGLKDLEISVWHGLYAPSGTPEYSLDQLNTALKRALKDPHVIARLADLGTEPVAEERASREVHRAFLASEVARWQPIIEAAGAFVE
jgi:tripartite-type tricarboxylate transporter receptor subunit TctC